MRAVVWECGMSKVVSIDAIHVYCYCYPVFSNVVGATSIFVCSNKARSIKLNIHLL